MKMESYEAVTRVPGSFEAAWQGMNLLLERKVPFVVKSALLPPNREEMEAFEAWAETIPWMNRPPSYAMFFDLRCRRDSEAKNRRIKKPSAVTGRGAASTHPKTGKILQGHERILLQIYKAAGDKLFSCGSGLGGGLRRRLWLFPALPDAPAPRYGV